MAQHRFSIGQVAGTSVGWLTAGALGAAIGGCAGRALEQLLAQVMGEHNPLATSISGTAASVFGNLASDTAKVASMQMGRRLSSPQSEIPNHELQRAFRQAFLYALYDIGGKPTFPERTAVDRARITDIAYFSTAQGNRLLTSEPGLAGQIKDFLKFLAMAVDANKVLSMTLANDASLGSVETFLDAATPANLASAFFDSEIRDQLQQESRLADDAPDFVAHLRKNLLPATLDHFQYVLRREEYTPAWRAFNQHILTDIQNKLRTGSQPSEDTREALLKLEALVGNESVIASLSSDVGLMLGEIGTLDIRMDERFDEVMAELAVARREQMQLLVALGQSNQQILTTVQKIERFLIREGDGNYKVIGSPLEIDELPPADADALCPYKGLEQYGVADAALFFGREQLTAELIGKLRTQRILTIVGDSGSGKSSLAQAGVIASLKTGALLHDGSLPPTGSRNWDIVMVRPGQSPLHALAVGVTDDLAHVDANALATELRKNPKQWLDHLQRRLNRKGVRHVLVFVDQLEEVFSVRLDSADPIEDASVLEEGNAVRQAFVDCLSAAGNDPDGRVTLLMTMRADVMDQIARYAGLPDLVTGGNQVFVTAVEDEKDICAIIEGPAKKHDWYFEPGLVKAILQEMHGQRDALPLLSQALEQMWHRRRGRWMTLNSYADAGGVSGAIAKAADDVYDALNTDQRDIMQAMLLRLTEPGQIAGRDLRRKVLVPDLLSGFEQKDAHIVLNRLKEQRLVTSSKTGIEIVHEALMRAWPRLSQWLDDYREDRLFHRRLSASALEHAQTGSARLLYEGERLQHAQEVLARRPTLFNEREKTFVAESLNEELRQQAVEREREQEKEAFRKRELTSAKSLAESNRQRLRATRIGLSFVSILLVAALIASGLAVRSTLEAQRQARINLAGKLAASSNAALSDRPQRSALLALESLQSTQQDEFVESASRTALHDALGQLNGVPLAGHEGSINTLTFSADNKWLATASADKTARLWSLAEHTREPIVLRGHERVINTLAFSPDNKWLATGSDDNTARLWSLAEPAREPIILSGHENGITSLTFSADDKWLVTSSAKFTGSADYTARLWSLVEPTRDPVVLRGHESGITSLAVSTDSKWLATGSRDYSVRLWSLVEPTHDPIILRGHENGITSLAFSVDNKWLATGSADYTARLWPLGASTANSIILRGHTDFISTLAFSADSRWLATGSLDNTARLWSLADPTRAPIILRGHEGSIHTLAFSADNKWLATGSDDNTARLWPLNSPFREPIILRGHESGINTLAFSADNKWLATSSSDYGSADYGSLDNAAHLWSLNAPTRDPIILYGNELYSNEVTINTLAFSVDNKWFATGSDDNTARLWSLADPTRDPIILHGHNGTINTLAFSADNKWLATGSDDNTARLWSLTDPTRNPIILSGHKNSITTLAFSADNKWLATSGRDNIAILWSVANSTHDPIILHGPKGVITTLAFSADSRWLATGSSDNTARLWSLADLTRAPIILRGHEDIIYTLAFSADNKWLATGSWDNTVRLWSLAAPARDPIILRGHESRITTLAFSTDNKWLATGSWDNTVRLWSLDINVLNQKVCEGVGRNLTQAEWATFVGGTYRKTCSQWPTGK